jgi:hypothetical protein
MVIGGTNVQTGDLVIEIADVGKSALQSSPLAELSEILLRAVIKGVPSGQYPASGVPHRFWGEI